jgi:8-amino-7-oxononanoate synthase
MKEDITGELEAIREGGLWRVLRTLEAADGVHVRREGRELVNFSSNDYLGLADSGELKAALVEGVGKYGAGSGASRLVCGSRAPHEALEAEIARFKRTEAALAFSSGYAVPLGVIPALVGRGDVIILDKLSHACLVDAAKLSGATIRVFPHNHLGKLERLLQSVREASARARVLVVTESIFSMDGDAAALAEIVDLKDRFGAWLLLDEAHAVGVIGPQGRGLAAALGLERHVDLHMGTLSKAAGLSGGYLAASRPVIELLVNKARSFIYSTAPPPALAHAACVSLKLIQGHEGEGRREKLRANSDSVTGWKCCVTSGSAILPVIIGDETRAVRVSERLLQDGFLVPAIRFPTVARGSARLRITLSAAHEISEIEALAVSLRRAMSELS